jgi:CheY-like chemotaxis protein
MSVLLAHPLGLRSSPWRGCCFHLDVPRIEVEAADTSSATDRETTLTAMGLIVIDDDAMVRDSLSTLLQHWGHRVIQGADAREVLACWEQASRPRLDAAVVDLRLREGRTGLEAIAQLRHRLGRQLPALVITGDIAPQRLKQLTEAAQPWLPKPLMPMRLRSWLSSLA